MIYAATPEEITARRFFQAVGNGAALEPPFAQEKPCGRQPVYVRTPAPSHWRSARTTDAIERLHEEFKRRAKTQTVLPSTETAAMPSWR